MQAGGGRAGSSDRCTLRERHARPTKTGRRVPASCASEDSSTGTEAADGGWLLGRRGVVARSWVQILAPPLISYMTLDELPHFSVCLSIKQEQ